MHQCGEYIHIYIQTIAAALALSLEKLNDNTGSIMKIFAFFDPDQIDENLSRDSAAYIPHLPNPIVQEELFKERRSFS